MAAQISSPLPPTITVLGGPTPNTLWAVNLYGSGGVLYSTENVPSDSAFSYYTNALLQYNSLISKSAIAPSPSASTAQIPAKSNTTPPITPSPTVFSASTPLTPPSSRSSGSITSSRQSGTSTAQSTSPAVTHSPSGHRLSNGAVAGIVVGVAVGLAFLTFLLTFLFMRRRGVSSGKRHHGGSNKRGIPASGSVGQQARGSEPKKPLFTETSSGSDSLDNFLPQSADDKTVQNNVTTTLDQIELHVENFYQNTPAPGAGSADAELATFNSPYLPNPLATLLPQTSNKVLLIKHALAHFVSSCISATAGPDWSLLPDDFVLLPSTIRSATSSRSMRPGFSRSLSRWRVLSAYLRPNPSEDRSYLAQRDHQINEMVQAFSRAFAPWQNPKYKDEDRMRSLSAIFKDAAGLGIWIFSQPSDLQFQWPKQSEVGSNGIAVAPALVKLTDERGQSLSEPQVMIKPAIQKIQS